MRPGLVILQVKISTGVTWANIIAVYRIFQLSCPSEIVQNVLSAAYIVNPSCRGTFRTHSGIRIALARLRITMIVLPFFRR